MKLLAFAAAALLAIPASAHPVDRTVPVQQIQALVTRHAGLDLFSGTVIVADRGKIVYSGAFGEANKDHRIATESMPASTGPAISGSMG